MPRPSEGTTTQKGAALALLAMTQFIVILDASIVNVALPSIGKTSTSPRRTSPGS